ncbi:hypothetical protein EDB85DRAFT_2194262 [Lactarius pseudohatsudake]|nr:hypothetical protein EDB85DRAFT_2194262 [Lactarius pseudohatsudake]
MGSVRGNIIKRKAPLSVLSFAADARIAVHPQWRVHHVNRAVCRRQIGRIPVTISQARPRRRDTDARTPGATLDPCKMFVARMLEIGPSHARSAGARVGAVRQTWGRRRYFEDEYRIVIVASVERFVDHGVGEMKSECGCILEVGEAVVRREGKRPRLYGSVGLVERYAKGQGAEGRVVVIPEGGGYVICVTTLKAAHGYRSTLETTVKSGSQFFDSDTWKKTRHESTLQEFTPTDWLFISFSLPGICRTFDPAPLAELYGTDLPGVFFRLRGLASPNLTARPPGSIDLDIDEDPATFVASPTADELLAAVSMLAPPQLQENNDLPSSGSAVTDALQAFISGDPAEIPDPPFEAIPAASDKASGIRTHPRGAANAAVGVSVELA